MKWTTIQRKVSDLIPYEANPRQMTEKQNKDLRASLEKFDLVEIPAINTDGIILAGHQRLRIMQALGRGDEVIDVRMPDRTLTPKEVQEYNIRSNKNTGEFDFDILANSFETTDLLEWGFDEKDLKIEADIEEDEVPEPPVEPVTKLGDLYQLGNHRLLCGDSLVDIDRLMGDTKAHMIFTDPPYNVDYGANKKHPSWKIRSIENDSMNDSDWADFNSHLAQTMSARCSGDVYVFGASSPDGMRARLAYVDAGFHWSATIIWKKQQLVLSPAKYQRIYEPCFYGWHESGNSSYVGDRKQVELWEIDRPHNSKEHPTMKPIELCAKGIQNSSNKGDIVLDMFLGSGSTLIACEQTGRVCYGTEIDPKYCQVILDRWANLTGKDPIRLSDGKAWSIIKSDGQKTEKPSRDSK